MDREQRNTLIQDYVDIRVFIESVKQLKNRAISKESEEKENEEVLEQAVD